MLLLILCVYLARMAYRRVLWGGSDDTIRTTIYNPSPSQAARDRNIHKLAQKKVPIYDSRQPLGHDLGPHPALYHECFAEMQDSLDDDRLAQIQLDSDIEDLVKELCEALASPTLADEDDYLGKLVAFFQKLLVDCEVVVKKKHRVSHGEKLEVELDFAILCITPYGEEVVLLAGEAKFRDGNGGSGPTQAGYGYRRITIRPEVSSQNIWAILT